jgi:TfoX/Sxy family transcriptional regulator of competence genes
MASEQNFADFVLDQCSGVKGVSARKTFGEYAVYKDGKVIGLICDNQLFIKPTDAGRKHLAEPVMAPPYKGAKPHFRIDERIDDRTWLETLIKVTAAALPTPKPKRK